MKLGIITHYHNNNNYGGVLQSYALCRVLQDMGHSAQQISFAMQLPTVPIQKRAFFFRALTAPRSIVRRMLSRNISRDLATRSNAVADFRCNKIPHTQTIYTGETITQIASAYDGYITGSDQVWNPIWYQSAYMLDFVPPTKRKISYAASLGQSQLTQEQKALFASSLSSFCGISVREESAVDLLQDISPVPVQWVLDPTLLLSAQQWDEVCPNRLIKEDYLFCYFLGNDPKERKLAKKYARKHKLKLVTLPYLSNKFSKEDLFFGDTRLFAVSPGDFISLIKHASVVFTDSFHASVFSNIYSIPYFAFPRQSHPGMNARIYSLTALFGTQDCFCDGDNKQTLAYLEAHNSPLHNNALLLQKQEESLAYLRKHLSDNSSTTIY